VFALEALLFLVSAVMAWRLVLPDAASREAGMRVVPRPAPVFRGAATSCSTD
jgi:hypothetical protein